MLSTVPTSSLAAFLYDLEMSGVTDVTCDQPFDYFSEPAGNSAKLSEESLVQVVADQPSVQLKMQEKPKISQPTINVEDIVWQSGSGQDVLVIAGTLNHKGSDPFINETKELFDKMMAAIGIAPEQILYTAVYEVDELGMSWDETMKNTIKSYVQAQITTRKPILLVGQEISQIMLGQNITKARQSSHKLGDCDTHVVMHPDMLIKQPIFKRMAWQDLLRFQEALNA